MWASCEELLIVFGHHETHGGKIMVLNCRSSSVNFVIWVTNPVRIAMSGHIHIVS